MQTSRGYPVDTSDAVADSEPLLCGGQSCAQDARRALGVLAGRWVFPILEALYFEGGSCRFRPLQRRLGAVSQKELARHLHALHQSGVVRRCERSAREVDYQLTAAGVALLHSAQGLVEWAREQDHPAPAATWLDPIARRT